MGLWGLRTNSHSRAFSPHPPQPFSAGLGREGGGGGQAAQEPSRPSLTEDAARPLNSGSK